MHLAVVSTFPPRACGLATFADDLRGGLDAASVTSEVVSLVREPAGPARQPGVTFEIRQHTASDYAAAAEFVNASSADAVSLQHEFGIFGGPEGRMVLAFMDGVRVPVITTLHTVLPRPEPAVRRALEAVLARSARVVVMTQTARRLLGEVYNADLARVDVIPHGVPDRRPDRPDGLRTRLGLDGRTVALTFGLLGPSKGIELALEALPQGVAVQPDLLYIVLGATHPEIVAHEGEVYRERLVEGVRARGLEDHVRFVDRYVTGDELWGWLCAADLYLSPYPGRDQICSGTLANALAAGLPVVSTPYLHAAEVLADGAGALVEPDDVRGFGEAMARFASDPEARAAARTRALEISAPAAWPRVGESYAETVRLALAHRAHPEPLGTHPGALPAAVDYLDRLTDPVGPAQHAAMGTPDRAHGYCTDDAGRALVVAWDAAQRLSGDDRARALRVARTCLAFVAHAQRPDGSFHNFMAYDRTWLDRPESEDTVGRALWGLGATLADAPDEPTRTLARTRLDAALDVPLTHPRAIAYAVCGLDRALDRLPGHARYRDQLRAFSEQLVTQFERTISPHWRWFSDAMTYANALVPHALLRASDRMTDAEGAARFREVGLDALEFVLGHTVRDGQFDPVGNRGWLRRTGERAVFDQQPIEAGYAALAWTEAARLTGESRYADAARLAVAWFHGRNRAGQAVFDPASGASFDGLSERGVNLNQGAESVIAVLLAVLAAERLGTPAPPPRSAQVRPAAPRPSVPGDPKRVRPTSA